MGWTPHNALKFGLAGCVLGALAGAVLFLGGDAAGFADILIYGSIGGVVLGASGLGRDLAHTPLTTSIPVSITAAVLAGAGEIVIIAPRGVTSRVEYLEAMAASAAFLFVIILASRWRMRRGEDDE